MNKFDRLCEFFKRSIKVHTNYSKNKEKKILLRLLWMQRNLHPPSNTKVSATHVL